LSSSITPEGGSGTPVSGLSDYPAVEFFFTIPAQPDKATIVWSFHCELRDAQDPRFVVWEASKVLKFEPPPPLSPSPT
jgi:hypothetical protein